MMIQLDKYPGYFLDIIEDSKCLYGYEIGVYSSWGKGIPKYLTSRPAPRYMLAQRIVKGYVRLDISLGPNGRKQVFLHKLIAEQLVPNPNPELYDTVDHIDGIKLNNHPSNLQWMSSGDNVRKGQSMGKWGTPPETYEIFYEDGNTQVIHNISKFSRENDYQASKLVAVSKGKRNRHKNVIKVIKQ